MSPHPTETNPPLRSDARRNREQVLAAAEGVFTEQGGGASLDDVARRAKVGIATLYRRFPTREALLAAMCNDRLLALARTVGDQGEKGDSVQVLRTFIEDLAGIATTYRGLATSIGAVLRHPIEGCAATTAQGQRLLDCAQGAGSLRPDLVMDDLLCVITAASMASVDASDRDARVSHVVGLFFDGLAGPQSVPRTKLRSDP